MVRYRGTFSGKCIAGLSVLYRYDHTIILYDLKIEEKVYDIKIGSELQSYKTGTMSSLNKRIELFKEGVENVIDER